MLCRIDEKKNVLLLVSNTTVREFPSFHGIKWSMKNTKGQTKSEPDVGMRFTAKFSNVWAQTTKDQAKTQW